MQNAVVGHTGIGLTFHYGIIKTRYDPTICALQLKLTFHYGIIKTTFSTQGASSSTGLTFHYGIIKTYLCIGQQ